MKPAAPPARPDLGNATLVRVTAAAVLLVALYFTVVQPALPPAWRTPGSAELYLTGVLGTLLLLSSMAFAVAKRIGRGGTPPAWFVAHVLGGTAGAVLVAIHSAGYLRRPPALLFLLILALVALGLWARIRVSRQMAATFATRQASFVPADPERRKRFAPIIARKRALLARLDPAAEEGTFSPTLRHWLRSPGLAREYARLAREESALMGTRASVGFVQALWRPLHLAIAYVFVAGIAIHVVTVTFFAGYVAGGGPITWWHITQW